MASPSLIKKLSSTSLLRAILIGLGGLLPLALMGCGESKAKTETTTSAPSAQVDFNPFVLMKAPAQPLTVAQARKTAKPDQEITVTGRIAGSMAPFSTDYATFILADDSLETCDLRPGDACTTPWDACCVDNSGIANARMTVQLLGSDARPLSQGLKGFRGLKELDRVVVTGTVDASSTPDNLILNATGLHWDAKCCP